MSPQDGSGELPRAPLVNKRELAKRVLGCSLPTVADMMDRWPDFPVRQRGDLSREWLFDPVEVVEFVTRKHREAAQESAKREEFFGQISLPFDEHGPESGLSPTARLAHLKAMQLADDLGKSRGALVEVSELMAATTAEWKALGDWLRRIPAELGRECNLPEPIMLKLRRLIEQGQRDFVVKMKTDFERMSKGQSRRLGFLDDKADTNERDMDRKP